MKRARTLLLLGLWVAVLPYLGFPYFWKNLIFTISGLGLVYISFVIYKEQKAMHTGNTTFENFSENSDFAGRRNDDMRAN
jgi:hypothetical protein